MGMKPRAKRKGVDPFIIKYVPVKGITKTLNANVDMIEQTEEEEDAVFTGLIRVSDAKLLGFIFRRNR